MNKTLIFRKIGGIISEITEQYQYLAENPENINPLELELFIANSHFLSEHLAILKKLVGDSDQAPEGQLAAQVREFEESNEEEVLPPLDETKPVVPAPEPAVLNPSSQIIPTREEASAGNWFQPVASEPAELFTEIKSVEENSQKDIIEKPAHSKEEAELPKQNTPEAVELRIPDVEEVTPFEQPVVFKQPEPVKPLTEGRAPTLNEILSASRNAEPVVSTLNQQENKDLRSMIKLNDKLMFVRDLFSGYNLAYNEAIEVVNRFSDFESADRFLMQNYAVKNRWAEKQNSVDQFYEVLKRRFS
jgi:hypothetical protein